MNIKIDEFSIRDSMGVKSFDVYQEHVSEGKKTKGKIIEINIAWGVKIERAIDIIVQEKMKEEVDTVSLNEFLELYEKYNDDLVEKIVSKIKI